MVSNKATVNCGRSWSHKLHTCPKWLSLKGHNSIKIDFVNINSPQAHLHYGHTMYAMFEKDPLKIMGGVAYTNSIPYNVKKTAKNGWAYDTIILSKIILSPSNLRTHILLMFVPLKTVGGVELITQTLYRRAWRTDGRTDMGKSLCPLTIVTGA